ncbi:hypothetical protein BJX63DRAFT_397251 [Aspergillus granulosus]|uniref:Uncharacterized protein n=1 Tax=Aspergillus granulosus TaxID=176169 RepID=A0ABR4HBR8_9EURO
MGSGGGGIGVERERSTSYHTRWTFTGGLQAGEQMSPFYRTLKWELRENESGARSNRSPIIHTAFALQHSDRPFIMRIEIQGRLQGSRDRLRQKMRGMRFPSPNYPEQGRSETLVRPNTVALRRRPLDMLAMGLSNAMERENLMRVPVEIPETLPVSFSVDDDARAATPQPDAQSSAQRMPDMHLNCHSEPTIIMPGSTSGMLLAPDDATSIAGTRQPSSVSNLSSSATLVGTPHEAFSPVSADSSAILGSAVDRFNGCNWERCRWEETPQSKEAVSTPEHATLAVLVRYPILHFLWRIIASILGAVPISKSSYEKKTTQDRGASGQETDPLSLPYPGQWPPE